MEEMERQTPNWMEGGKLNEVLFAEEFLKQHQMVCCEGAFFSREGRVDNERLLKRHIYLMLKDHVTSAVRREVDGVLATMRLACAHKNLPRDPNVIHLANGTYHLADGFYPEKHFCRYRLPVSWGGWDAKAPTWEAFLEELLSPIDIQTLQEFMGYCLIPTNKAQKMLIITGQGGEGKSRIGVVMKAIFGSNLSLGSIAKVETNPFARADLEHMLVMVDDDLQMEALPSTNTLKSIITAETPMDLERKGEQSYQGYLTTRFIAFGNGVLRSLHDRSYGFFRRQIILTALPRDPDRIDDPCLSEKLIAEKEGIFLWCLQGLMRLMCNNYQFTISPKAQENISKAVSEGNNILEFLGSSGYFAFDYNGHATSRRLYECYRSWCEDNALRPLSDRTFWCYMRDHALELNLDYTNTIAIGNGKCARGFRGIRLLGA